ncbi:MAG: DJ-1/PfpI family protein [Ruminococcaceae bacterium]|nr:DJ-1/PfpI family protein [Oscillospiraceae bacterium]
MVYVFLADGFEEIEALAPVDFLRRAGITVKTASLKGKNAVGAHNIEVIADINIDDISLNEDVEAVILPGGMPGSQNLYDDERVHKAIDFAVDNNKLVCAICAAPFILGRKGLLKGKNATCFPGFQEELTGAIVKNQGVVKDGNIITAQGAGVAWEFGEKIASELVGSEISQNILLGLQWKK